MFFIEHKNLKINEIEGEGNKFENLAKWNCKKKIFELWFKILISLFGIKMIANKL